MKIDLTTTDVYVRRGPSFSDDQPIAQRRSPHPRNHVRIFARGTPEFPKRKPRGGRARSFPEREAGIFGGCFAVPRMNATAPLCVPSPGGQCYGHDNGPTNPGRVAPPAPPFVRRKIRACAILYTYDYNDLFSSRRPFDQKPA